MGKYWDEYKKRPIGKGNPYWCCAGCGRSDPQINGDIKKHMSGCSEVEKKLLFDAYTLAFDEAVIATVAVFGKNSRIRAEHAITVALDAASAIKKYGINLEDAVFSLINQLPSSDE